MCLVGFVGGHLLRASGLESIQRRVNRRSTFLAEAEEQPDANGDPGQGAKRYAKRG